jgi:hypothetical protein
MWYHITHETVLRMASGYSDSPVSRVQHQKLYIGASSQASTASRSKLWPPPPHSTGSRMTLPLSGQRH